MKNLLLLVCCIICLMQSKLSAQTIIYVDSLNGNDANSGIAWTSSFKTLGKGLEYAHQTPTVEKVLVAKGTYYPTHKPFNMNINQIGVELSSTSNVDKSFHIRTGLEVFGGYPNGGGLRDLIANPTILSGLLGGTDTAFHVVIMDSSSNWNILNDTSKLDGFRIENGNSNGAFGSSILVNGIPISFVFGGGLFSVGGHKMISNNIFTNNNAMYGGAVYNSLGDAKLDQNKFIKNKSYDLGGAVYSALSKVDLSNTLFDQNTAINGGAICISTSDFLLHKNIFVENHSNNGGAIYIYDTYYSKFYENTFSKNKATQDGGAINVSSMDTIYMYNNVFDHDTAMGNGGACFLASTGYAYFGNNTLCNNVAFSEGGALYLNSLYADISNCIFYQNKINLQSNIATADFRSFVTSNYWFKNCIMQLDSSKYLFSLGNPLYSSSNNYFNLNPIFKGGSGSDSLSLADCSPAIDAGKDNLLLNGILVDIEGNNRVHDVPYVTNINANTIDLGAYENQSNSSVSPISITSNFTSVQANPPVLYNHGYFTNIAYGSPVSANWYDAAIGGNLLKFSSDTFPSPDLYSTTTYYAIPALGSCEYNGARTPVVDYISPCMTYTSLYVDSSVLISGNGSSWGTALKTFNEALAISHACSNVQKIYVAKGTFTPSDKLYQMDINKVGTQTNTPFDYDKKFHIRVGLEVYGGYPNGGGLRDIDAYPTVLQGILSNGDSVEEIVYVDSSVNWATSNDSTIIDGFVIQYAKVHGVDLKMGSNRISHCTIQQNHSINFGGGIYCSTGRNLIQSNKIINNSASLSGGGIFANNSTYNETSTIQDNLIEYNSAGGPGGGISGAYIINIKGNSIKNNSSTSSGGGIAIQNFMSNSIPIEDNIISMNHANYRGGGLYINGGSPIKVIHNFVDSNSSGNEGAGIYSSGNIIRLRKCSITNNQSLQDGGGLFFTNTIDTIDACKIIGNQSTIGGGLNITGTKSCIFNSLIAYNKASNQGGGGRINCGIIKFCNNTVVYNRSNYYGGAISLIYSDAYVSNSIFWKNKYYNSETALGADIYMPGPVLGLRLFKNNFMQLRDTQYTFTGSGIYDLGINSTCKFAIDPLFKGGAFTDSFNVVDCSMAIDAGLDNLILNLSLFDLENNIRFHDVPFVPNLGINTVDVGAYENQSMASSSPVSPTLGYLQSTPSAIYGSGIFLNQAIGSSHFANWYDAQTGGTLLQQGSNSFQTPILSSTTTYYAVAAYGLCESSSPRIPITDTVLSCNSTTNLYVDSSVASSGDGSSWAQAFKTLSDAIAYSHSCPSIEKIHVAKGTYYPTNYSYTMNAGQVGVENISSNMKRKTFHLRTGIEMYGGYSSGGGSRNVIANPTILEGILPTGDSVYHVVIIDSSVNWFTPNDTTILDGFFVQHGCAVGSTIESVNGMDLLPYAGGGIYIQRGLNLLRNNIISSNRTWSYGGGIFKNIGQSFFVNNIISSNNCEYYGGGIYLSKGRSEVTNNTIYSNSVVHYGAGLYIDSGYHKISNTIFWNNMQQGLSNSLGSDIALNDTNEVFTNNIFQLYKTQYYYPYSLGVNPSGNLFHSDPMFLGGSLGDSLSLKPCSPAIDAGIDLLVNSFSQSDINSNNRFFDITYLPNSGTNTVDMGAFENADTSSISPVSPTLTSIQVNPISIVGGGVFTNMVNGASHSVNWYDAPTGGNLQYYNDSIWVSPTLTSSTYYYAIPAYGRCESNQPRTPILDSVSACLAGNIRYVDSSIAVSGDGTSWLTAFKTLSDALATAQSCINIDTIKVAKGTYYPTRKVFQMDTNQISHELSSIENRDKTFQVRQGLNVMGGYSSGGTTRNINLYPTILDGALNSTDTSYHVVMIIASSYWQGVNDSTRIDGFTIQNGRADSTHSIYANYYDYYSEMGGGLLNVYGELNLYNCNLRNNVSIGSGGALCIFGSSDYNNIVHNTFKNNRSYSGGAIALGSYNDNLDANSFLDNEANFGGAISCTSNYGFISNNVFYNNHANFLGGAIYNYYGLNVIYNTFFANKADSNAGAITLGSSSILYNNIFWGNLRAGDRNIQGADYLNLGSSTISINAMSNMMQLPSSSYVTTSSGNYNIGYSLSNQFNTNPLFIDSTNITGLDGINQTSDDGLQLQFSSNGINTGTNNTPGITLHTDNRKVLRIQNFISDIGAYEYGSCLTSSTTNYIFDTICSDGFFPFNGQNLNMAGVYADSLISSGGCDSVIILTLTVNPITIEPTQVVTVYNPYTWAVNGITYTISGVYTYTGTNANGCSDIYTLDLLILDSPSNVHNYLNSNSVQFYPNPTQSILHTKSITKIGSNYQIEINDMIGKRIKVVQSQAVSNSSHFEIQTDDIANGLYMVRLFEDGKLIAERKIVIHH